LKEQQTGKHYPCNDCQQAELSLHELILNLNDHRALAAVPLSSAVRLCLTEQLTSFFFRLRRRCAGKHRLVFGKPGGEAA